MRPPAPGHPPARPGPPRPTPPTTLHTFQAEAPAPAPAPAPAASSGFASIFGSQAIDLDDVASILNMPAPVPDRPLAAPAVPPAPAEDIDLLGLPTKPRSRTTTDILKLFEKKEEKDLLAGDVFDSLVDLVPQTSGEILAPISEMNHVTQVPLQPSAIDDMATLEPTAFNAANAVSVESTDNTGEMLPQTSPAITYTDVKSSVQSSSPISIPARVNVAKEEDFDAFSSRFESAGKEDSLVVEADPFDPFSGAASAKGSSGMFHWCTNGIFLQSSQVYMHNSFYRMDLI